jgi:predicted nucleic acid-binding protein
VPASDEAYLLGTHVLSKAHGRIRQFEIKVAQYDCLIATHAIFAGIPLLHRDRDFELIAGVEPNLMLVPAKHG